MAKILVAEDEQSSRAVIYHSLTEMGHTVICSPDGAHAWVTLEVNDGIDLLITDVVMPELDGRELVRRVRGSEDFSQLPIIIMSGVVSLKEIAELLDTGATMFMHKPLRVEELREEVERCLE
ncbi:MAG: response regulator [Planctomycetota bacterium]|jgi:DNA-binding response OmpR family regulator